MVRVISVHHFASQQVLTVEQPTASTVAPPHRLLLALSSHCVEVRDLKADGDVLFTFPTVDEVTQIVHCLNGDYVATMETKYNRQNRELNFVRVYINWDSVAALQQSKMNSSGASLGLSECGMVQPMRARIAGRVTPTTNHLELGSLEMIEIPTKRNPSGIEVCQVSGNILILSNKTVTIYTFEVKTHDISKLKFIDFEELSINIELTFLPTQVSMCENYIAALNKDSAHLFKIVSNGSKDSGQDLGNDTSLNFKYNDDGKIDYKKLLREESLSRSGSKITVHLPSIMRENSAIHRHSPFTFCDKDLKAFIKSTSPIENKAQNFYVENLIQLKLKPILIENAHKRVTEEFKFLVLKPMYVEESMYKPRQSDGNKILKSVFRNKLHSVTCLIATQQEGYFYQFCDQDTSSTTIDNCIAVYPFTSPVFKVLLEDYFLHALTETGLESYTLRTGHRLCRDLQTVDGINIACPDLSESICLVGLRPFLGIEQILLADNHIVLLANGDSSPTHSVGSNSSSTTSYWTLYSLELPSPRTIFNDISIVANAHRFTSSQTYCHLVGEAHMILRLALLLSKWAITDSNVGLLKPKRGNTEDVRDAYRTSCALLADHYIMCTYESEYSLAVPYYKMALVSPYDVIKRVKKIQEQSNNQQVKGLIHYLKTVLFDSKASSDVFNSCSKQNFAEAVLDLFERHNFQELPSLILKVSALREFGTDKLINILNNGNISLEGNATEKILALVTLYILRGNFKKANELLHEIKKENLKLTLRDNWELLFESFGAKRGGLSFSELTIQLMNMHPDLLADLFLIFVEERRVLTLGKLLKVYLEFLPSSIGHDANQGGLVLQRTLELHFKRFFERHENGELAKVVYDRPTHDAIKLLVRSYLSQLQLAQVKEKGAVSDKEKENEQIIGYPDNDADSESTDKDVQQEKFKYNSTNKTFFGENRRRSPAEFYLFSNLRHEYLNRMPPFQALVIPNVDKKKAQKSPKNDEADLTLRKLQALLCSQVVPNQVILEVNAFLALNENLRGHLSLQTVIMTVNDAVLFLMESCPQCLLQYGKDRFTKPDEWKFLIATVQRRILRMSQDDEQNRASLYYKKLLKDILTYVATNMNLEHLIMVFPQHMNYSTSNIEDNTQTDAIDDSNVDILNEIQDYEPYIMLCKETMHANQIKKLITATGQQLLCTLNL